LILATLDSHLLQSCISVGLCKLRCPLLWFILAIIVNVVQLGTHSAHADSQTDRFLAIAGPSLQAFNLVSETDEQLSAGLKMANALAANQRPPAYSGDWQKLARNFHNAARDIDSTEIPTSFDEAKYSVSTSEFLLCRHRSQSLIKLNEYLQELRAAQKRGRDSVELLNRTASGANSIKLKVSELGRSLKELRPIWSAVLEYSTLFDLLVFDLDVSVDRAANDLLSSVNTKADKVSSALLKVQQKERALSGWLPDLENAKCNLEGTWAGAIQIDNNPAAMTLTITKKGDGYSVSYTLAGKPNRDICILKIDVVERRLEFRPSCRPPASDFLFSLKFSDDFQLISGVHTDIGDPDMKNSVYLKSQ
jgi:hypothetical protein